MLFLRHPYTLCEKYNLSFESAGIGGQCPADNVSYFVSLEANLGLVILWTGMWGKARGKSA
jgi:hypothetical protein